MLSFLDPNYPLLSSNQTLVITSLEQLSFKTSRINYPSRKSLPCSLQNTINSPQISSLSLISVRNCPWPNATTPLLRKSCCLLLRPLWSIILFSSFTNHCNLTFMGPSTTQSQCTLHWHLVIEEYNVMIVHRAGASNFATDALSCLPFLEPEEPPSVRQQA
jgi:hypothetical protein